MSSPSLVLTPLRVTPARAQKRSMASVTTRAILQSKPSKTKASKAAMDTQKKLSQRESVQQMGGIVAQAVGVGVAVPVGLVSLVEASKKIPGAEDVDLGLYGFIALTLGFGAWWVGPRMH